MGMQWGGNRFSWGVGWGGSRFSDGDRVGQQWVFFILVPRLFSLPRPRGEKIKKNSLLAGGAGKRAWERGWVFLWVWGGVGQQWVFLWGWGGVGQQWVFLWGWGGVGQQWVFLWGWSGVEQWWVFMGMGCSRATEGFYGDGVGWGQQWVFLWGWGMGYRSYHHPPRRNCTTLSMSKLHIFKASSHLSGQIQQISMVFEKAAVQDPTDYCSVKIIYISCTHRYFLPIPSSQENPISLVVTYRTLSDFIEVTFSEGRGSCD